MSTDIVPGIQKQDHADNCFAVQQVIDDEAPDRDECDCGAVAYEQGAVEGHRCGVAEGLERAAAALDAGAVESDEDAEAEKREGRDVLARIFASNASTKRFYAARIRALVPR